MTATMHAMVLTRFGGPDAFELKEVARPAPGPRQVLARVMATAINPLDYQIRRGDYGALVQLPTIIGHDVSGVVEQVGASVTEFAAGDEVYYTPKIFGGAGSYAQWHVADVDLVSRKPKNLSHIEAASLTLVGGTLMEGLLTRAQLKLGESILVHGAAGGVGTIAVQIAKACGAWVIATARGRDREFVAGLGADEIIDFETESYIERVGKLTEGRGVDVVLDTLGRDTLSRSPQVLADSGRVVTLVDTPEPQNLLDAWGRNATYHFVFTRQYSGKLDTLRTLVERGRVRPVVGRTFKLQEIAEAHRALETKTKDAPIRGKIAIEVEH
ncbi:zinc-dependent alcohol dehydrogenase family protein [Steroidobacter sp. S1-65]|uniref:Zinc-dependent alcohol dehydrogenase family protein n=1 Tax=Steroidobacter gossypii TaxID=2805490 RepID=A0ABS1X6K1_9GAMM|nr:zinc-dependent alcohol dehydrogenase family protein [Steroidobacter gossypii]MBM0108844.1 zinc-dependent alcohol dehydrogenase family protein [Steroidobacter gossypii]